MPLMQNVRVLWWKLTKVTLKTWTEINCFSIRLAKCQALYLHVLGCNFFMVLKIVMSRINRSRNGIAYNWTPKTDFSELSEFIEKRQLQRFRRISFSLQWFLFEIYVTTIAEVRNVYFPVIWAKTVSNFSVDTLRLNQNCETFRVIICRFEFFLQILMSTLFCKSTSFVHRKCSQEVTYLLAPSKLDEHYDRVFSTHSDWKNVYWNRFIHSFF